MVYTTEELKSAVLTEIDRHGDQLIRVAKVILENPETGFQENKTSLLVGRKFRELGIPYQGGIAFTGMKGILDGGTPGPTVGVMGKLDTLRVFDNPHADPESGAAHACGHHCQIGMMLGVAVGLTKSGIMRHLSGRVALMAVPAEEYIDIEYRDELRREGKIEFLGGKQEFIRLGVLDDVDLAMMTHTSSGSGYGRIAFGGTNNGVIKPAKAMAMTVVDLLADNAIKAKSVIAERPAKMTKNQYLELQGSRLSEELYAGK